MYSSYDIQKEITGYEYDLKQAQNDKYDAETRIYNLEKKIASLNMDLQQAWRDEAAQAKLDAEEESAS